ncbi:MAG: GNAT family N-acetyltransferase [Deltaproteobacteria bacterium]|uniref:GNAT family N-acetyltransferase n=1 Tax=Candidatus Zymogenus saltonus TaxID=2844893 RepID=A0A9D8KHY0_9DELT|nr:GNAT family N-acetyltransferase [Candidatus Zymogenus saltonus]
MKRDGTDKNIGDIEKMKKKYPEKFVSEEDIFGHIHRGDRIFISTACGEPQYLVSALIKYVEAHPKAVIDAEVYHVWTLGVAPYAGEKFKYNFRHNSFFIGHNTREAVNEGVADYTPIFLSEVPELLNKRMIQVDVAMIQTSPPDTHGYMSLGVSLDIVKAAAKSASVVISQVNSHMPRVHGDGFIHIEEVDFIVMKDEPLMEYEDEVPGEIAKKVGKYVARIINDGDTIQVGYGSLPNAIIENLENKKHLGVHTELLSDGIANLMKKGVIDNSMKNINRGKTTATFCMGKKETYDFIHDNPGIEFRAVDYTNNPLIISENRNMTAINSALKIDLTGQATAESIGHTFYSGIGGQADFMRGAVLAPGGKTILSLQSTAEGGKVSRIIPYLKEGEGVTLNRGDIHYVVTEYGIAYLHGKNIRERAMSLIIIAHPDFRSWLIDEAKRLNLIYRDQAFIPGKAGEYPEHLETYKTTKKGLTILLRPAKISDEPLMKEFFYDLSDNSRYKRFFSNKPRMPHEQLQMFAVVDYSRDMTIIAVIEQEEKEVIVGVAQYKIFGDGMKADMAMMVKDEYQNKGIGSVLLSYMSLLAKRQGLLGFTGNVLVENKLMLHMLERSGFDVEQRSEDGIHEVVLNFREDT